MNAEPNDATVQQTQRAAEPPFIEQVVIYRNKYHNKLQSELRQRHQNPHKIKQCNIILTSSRYLMEMHERGENKSEAFRKQHHFLLESIQKFESYRRNHPILRMIPPSPRFEKKVHTTPDGTSAGDRMETDAQEQRLPGMQEGDVFL